MGSRSRSVIERTCSNQGRMIGVAVQLVRVGELLNQVIWTTGWKKKEFPSAVLYGETSKRLCCGEPARGPGQASERSTTTSLICTTG